MSCLECGRALDWDIRFGHWEDNFCSQQCEGQFLDTEYDSDDAPTPYRNGPGLSI